MTVRFTPCLWPGRRCRKAASEFEALGFRRIGSYHMRPTAKRGIVLVGDEGRIVAEAWDGALKGLYVNVYALAEDGAVLELSGAPDARYPDPPWHRMVETAGTTSLVKKMRAFRAAEPWEHPLLVTRANYREIALRKRRRFIEWQLKTGQARASMVPGLERRTGMKADPESLEILRQYRP